MIYITDERIKNYLDTNQMHREQMCRAVLAMDKRFSDVKPRHPRGGRDGGRDIEATYRENEIAFGAVGFINQANDSNEQKKTIKNKFASDLDSALEAKDKLTVFVFFTNISLTIGEKEKLIKKAKKKGINFCEIFDRERIRISLDSTDGFSIRFQFLNIPLSEAEQASFFSKWGDDIQSVISSGFQKVDTTLKRLLFLQEANDSISQLTISLELKRKYLASEIGHFRFFCYLMLKEPKYNMLSILFGVFDKSNRLENSKVSATNLQSGLQFGTGTAQWEHLLTKEKEVMTDDEKWTSCGTGSGIGKDELEFLSISYRKGSFIRLDPVISLRDLDDATFLPFLNKSLAEKVKAIHVYSNGYKLKEIDMTDINIDLSEVSPNFPVLFEKDELLDQWVRIRPKIASSYHLRFYERTPIRLFVSHQVENSLEKK